MHTYWFFKFKSFISHQGLSQEAIELLLYQYCPPRVCSIFKKEIFVQNGHTRTLLVATLIKDGWCSSARIWGAAIQTEYSVLVLAVVWSRLCGVQWARIVPRYNWAQQQTCFLPVSDWHLHAWWPYIINFHQVTDFHYLQTSDLLWLVTTAKWQRFGLCN